MNIKELPEVVYTGLSVSLVFLSLGLTLALVRATDVNLAIANTRLQVSQKITETIDTASELEATAVQLQQQQRQYYELKEQYEQLVEKTNGAALKQLKPAIEGISPTPIEPTLTELKQQQAELQELIGGKR